MVASKKIRKQYQQLLPKLNETMKVVEDRLSDLPSSDFTIETNFKPFDSIINKFGKDKLNHLLEMPDLIRGRIFFSTDYVFEEVIKMLKAIFDKNINKIDKKKGEAEHGLEYFGVIHCDLLIDGIKFELQVIPIEFKRYKPFLHNIFQQLRSKNKLSEEEKDKLRKTHNDLYHQLNHWAKNNRK
jgi:hypothetical protein